MATERTISFVVAEDESLLRASLVKKIEQVDSRLVCKGAASDGDDAVRLVNSVAPDVLVTDIRMPLVSGLELIEQVKHLHPALAVVVVSGYDDFEYARRALQLGVIEYLLKPVRREKLISALAPICQRILLASEETYPFLGEGSDRSLDALSEYANAMETKIVNNLKSPLSLSNLAASLGLKPAYAVKVYKRFKGLTPMRHLTVLRINRARQLLESNPSLEVKQVADLVGFEDPFYFSRVFTRETGVSPSAWRDPQNRSTRIDLI